MPTSREVRKKELLRNCAGNEIFEIHPIMLGRGSSVQVVIVAQGIVDE